MAISLPVEMEKAKESNSNFFIELYRIELPSYSLLLASCNENITFSGETYLGYPIKRGEITKTVDSRVDNCDIEISNTNEYFTLSLFNGKSFLGCRVYVYRIMYPESLNNPNLIFPVFYGQLDSPELTENGTFKCSIVSDIPNMNSCRTMNYTCSNVFGDENCKHEIKTVSGPIESMGIEKLDGSEWAYLQSSALGTEYWMNAIVTIDGISRRVIRTAQNKVYFEYAFPDHIDLSGNNLFTVTDLPKFHGWNYDNQITNAIKTADNWYRVKTANAVEFLCDSYVPIAYGKEYTVQFKLRADSPINSLSVSFYTNDHHGVPADLKLIGANVYEVSAKYIFSYGVDGPLLRCPDFHIRAGSPSYVDIKDVKVFSSGNGNGVFTIRQDCDKTAACCSAYNNRQRYGGFLFVPFEFVAKT